MPIRRCNHLQQKNPLDLLLLFLKHFFKNRYDLGFSLNSYGKETKNILKLAKTRFILKGESNNFLTNYYDRVRLTLGLKKKHGFRNKSDIPKNTRTILFCPDSSEARRSLTNEQIDYYIEKIKTEWPLAEVTLITNRKNYYPNNAKLTDIKQTQKSSIDFIRLIQQSDLVASVDSGPLHIASAFEKPVLGLFSSAIPYVVMNSASKGIALRAHDLADFFCEVKSCKTPVCMDRLPFAPPFLTIPKSLKVVREECPYRKKTHQEG